MLGLYVPAVRLLQQSLVDLVAVEHPVLHALRVAQLVEDLVLTQMQLLCPVV